MSETARVGRAEELSKVLQGALCKFSHFLCTNQALTMVQSTTRPPVPVYVPGASNAVDGPFYNPVVASTHLHPGESICYRGNCVSESSTNKLDLIHSLMMQQTAPLFNSSSSFVNPKILVSQVLADTLHGKRRQGGKG